MRSGPFLFDIKRTPPTPHSIHANDEDYSFERLTRACEAQGNFPTILRSLPP